VRFIQRHGARSNVAVGEASGWVACKKRVLLQASGKVEVGGTDSILKTPVPSWRVDLLFNRNYLCSNFRSLLGVACCEPKVHLYLSCRALQRGDINQSRLKGVVADDQAGVADSDFYLTAPILDSRNAMLWSITIRAGIEIPSSNNNDI
jgi:hypothetical protein